MRDDYPRSIATTGPRGRWLFPLALLVLLLAAGCGADDVSDDAGDSMDAAPDQVAGAVTAPAPAAAEGRASAATEAATAATDGASAAGLASTEAPAAEATDDAAAEGQDTGQDPAAADSGTSGQVPIDTAPPGTATTGERIIKEGTVTLEVEPGEFDAAFGQVVARAQQLGGHVAGSSSASEPAPAREGADDDPDLVSGQVTIRVPVRSFEDLLTSVGESGRIVDRDVTSQDVTAEFTDLESRRRHLQAQERFYLGLLETAQTVPDAIAVQQQLDGVQGQIEEITGRLNLLGDRTSFSTLTVRIREQGVAVAEAEPVLEEEPGGLTPYLREAVDVFVATVGAIIVVATFLAPLLVLALLGTLVWRAVRPRRTAEPLVAPVPVPVREPVGVGATAPTARAAEDGPPPA